MQLNSGSAAWIRAQPVSLNKNSPANTYGVALSPTPKPRPFHVPLRIATHTKQYLKSTSKSSSSLILQLPLTSNSIATLGATQHADQQLRSLSETSYAAQRNNIQCFSAFFVRVMRTPSCQHRHAGSSFRDIHCGPQAALSEGRVTWRR